MHHDIQLFAEYAVTPFVGVWIETCELGDVRESFEVTPFVGVWIETTVQDSNHFDIERHTLRGCVD